MKPRTASLWRASWARPCCSRQWLALTARWRWARWCCAPRTAVTSGPVKVAVRPEAWRIHRQGAGMLPARLDKRAYLGAVYEYTFETALGPIFVVSSDLDDVLAVGTRCS